MKSRDRVVLIALMIVCGLTYDTCSAVIYEGVWGNNSHNIEPDPVKIMVFTSPAEGHIARSAERAKIAALRVGFRPTPFEVRQTNRLYRLTTGMRRGTSYAGYLWGVGIVMADTGALVGLTDAELDCVFAHEIGHILQHDEGYQRTLTGPPELQHLMIEVDADLRAQTMCGENQWKLFFARHIGTRTVTVK